MRIADLAGRRVAVWGFGREGRAALLALRRRLPALPLTLYCSTDEAAAARAFDPALSVQAHAPEAAELAAFEVVLKSPGISAYQPALLAAQAQGTAFTSGTALWFAENPAARVIGVTGTKGKSTTSALIAHLARSLGVRTALAGNIGLPLLELLDQQAALWVLELSSFQTGEAGPLALGVITSLYEEHLDWHGSRERYVQDKLKLAAVAQALLVNGTQPALARAQWRHRARRPGRVRARRSCSARPAQRAQRLRRTCRAGSRWPGCARGGTGAGQLSPAAAPVATAGRLRRTGLDQRFHQHDPVGNVGGAGQPGRPCGDGDRGRP
jgi:UDP-N-acetylmuramoylalanine--D-glutamate ligase